MNFRILLCLAVSFSLALVSCKRDSGGKPPAPVAAERPLPDTVSIAFYNVENLFDFNSDGTEYDEYKPGWYGWTEETYRTKLDNAARVVAALGADVVGLCEVENMNALKELQAELDRIGATYQYAAVAEAAKSATVTAVLSKLPIKEKFAYPVEKSRSILEARIAGGGGDEFRVFVNHWPSKRQPESARLEAARALKQRLDELPPDCDYVIIGDFNANYNEFATFRTEGFDDTKGRTGINHVLKTTIEGAGPQSPLRFVCKGELAACADCRYNLWLELPENERKSYVYRGAAQTIDNIIAPPSMFDGKGYSYLDGSFGVFTWDGELLRDGVPYRWQMIFKGKQKYHAGKGYSDHLPVTARLVRASVLKSIANNDTSLADTGASSHTNTVSINTDTSSPHAGYCQSVDPGLVIGDFAVSVDGWMSGDSRFTVARDSRFARTGTHSLRVSGRHDTENRTAAKARLEPRGAKKYLSLSVRGEGNLSIRIRRSTNKWVYFNAPEFTQSKSARYKNWKSGSWVNLKFPLPESASASDDVEVELRAGKGEPLNVWIDRIRLE